MPCSLAAPTPQSITVPIPSPPCPLPSHTASFSDGTCGKGVEQRAQPPPTCSDNQPCCILLSSHRPHSEDRPTRGCRAQVCGGEVALYRAVSSQEIVFDLRRSRARRHISPRPTMQQPTQRTRALTSTRRCTATGGSFHCTVSSLLDDAPGMPATIVAAELRSHRVGPIYLRRISLVPDSDHVVGCNIKC